MSSTQALSPTSIATSATRYLHSETSSPLRSAPKARQEHNIITPTKSKLVAKNVNTPVSTRGHSGAIEQDPAYQSSPVRDPHPGNPVYIPDNLSNLIIKDSVEDLPSAVPRSPTPITLDSPRLRRASSLAIHELDSPALPSPLSPTRGSSPLISEALEFRFREKHAPKQSLTNPEIPETQQADAMTAVPMPPPLAFTPAGKPKPFYQRHKPSHLKLTRLDGTNTDFDINRKSSASSATSAQSAPVVRPLSPFTSSGFLRRLVSSPEPTIFTTKNELRTESRTDYKFDEVIQGMTKMRTSDNRAQHRSMRSDQEKDPQKSVRGQRSGHSLMSLLGRRAEKRSDSRQSAA